MKGCGKAIRVRGNKKRNFLITEGHLYTYTHENCDSIYMVYSFSSQTKKPRIEKQSQAYSSTINWGIISIEVVNEEEEDKEKVGLMRKWRRKIGGQRKGWGGRGRWGGNSWLGGKEWSLERVTMKGVKVQNEYAQYTMYKIH